jgi:hypothetical protein
MDSRGHRRASPSKRPRGTRRLPCQDRWTGQRRRCRCRSRAGSGNPRCGYCRPSSSLDKPLMLVSSGESMYRRSERVVREGKPTVRNAVPPMLSSPLSIEDSIGRSSVAIRSLGTGRTKLPRGVKAGTRVSSQPGGLSVKERVEGGEQAPWDGSWERRPVRGAARPPTTSAVRSEVDDGPWCCSSRQALTARGSRRLSDC